MKSKLFVTFFLLINIMESYSQKNESTIILVHGAGHGSWCWSKVVPLLLAKHINAIAVDLPSHGKDTLQLFNYTLADDVEAIKKVAESIQGKVILAGHSSGGVAIAQASEILGKDKVEKLIFLDAFMPKNGESVMSLAAQALQKSKTDNTNNTTPVMLFSSNQKAFQWNPEIVAEHFYHDCSKEDIAYAKENLRWQASASIATAAQLSDSVYGSIPKYYILCTQSKDLDKSSIANNVPIKKLFKLPSSHSPFFSMPQNLIDIFLKISKD